ncbi:MAG TPA: flagellar hook-basal body protein [Candidatus Hydrogenedentes bacterium]|nr:flagellar hook-basal body protein [Candidatus Hydrogenedentota bacterium]HOS03044.1 flagellar hook-basal body protein [Candidatus Hydrogenedentota bacterium]
MLQGLYAAANGLVSEEARQAVIANNIANVFTAGFKRQEPVQQGFYSVFRDSMSVARLNAERSPGGGVKLVETYTDPAEGTVTTTGNNLDIALSGPGYLVVDTPQGERFTRAGKFMIDSDGQLANDAGHKVQGTGGPIDVRGGAVQFDGTGRVIVDGAPVGTLRLVEFEDPRMLTREGNTLFAASQAAMDRSAPADQTRVAAGSLEMSNVQLPHEMIGMTLGLRAYSANQRVISAFDETLGNLIERVGMPI